MKLLLSIALALLLSACRDGGATAHANSDVPRRTEFTIGWSAYVGWVPWEYAEQTGIVKKWADAYGIKIDIVQFSDYMQSVQHFADGHLDGVTATTQDALRVLAASKRPATALIVGDYSNGNDGIVSKSVSSLAGLRGQSVHLVAESVSRYLLERALEMSDLRLEDVRLVNVSDAQIVSLYGRPEVQTVVTWNPQLSEIRNKAGGRLLFDSSAIPGEIIDSLYVNAALLDKYPELGRALVGIWYETLAVMTRGDGVGAGARAAMARILGVSQESFAQQLRSTHLFDRPEAAAGFMESHHMAAMTRHVWTHEVSRSTSPVESSSLRRTGIQLPRQAIGDASNIVIRFDPVLVHLSAEGKLQRP